MAKPIICSASTGQTDVIVEGETGRYVPVGDADRLRAAITELLDDPAEVRRLGQAARDWVVQTADLDVYVRGLAARVREHSGNDRPRLRSF